MSYRWLALWVLPLAAHAQDYQFPIEIIEYVDSTRVVAFIDESDIPDAVNWHPFEEALPLTIEGAMGAVQQYIASAMVLAEPRLEEVELRRIPHHENRWHYMVKIREQGEDNARIHYFVVLMNGKVIPAMREPESVK